MRIKRGIRIGLAALFITLGIILVSSCGGGFTVTFVDSLRPPAKAPVKKTPPKTVEKEAPQAPAEEPKTEIAVSEEPKTVEEPEKSVSEGTKTAEGPEGTEGTAAKKPAVTEEPEQKEEATAPVEKKPEQTPEKVKQNEQKKKTETVKNKEETSAKKGEEQKIAKETEKETASEKKKTEPPETTKNAVSITGIVSLQKNTFYITELESKKRYKLVGLKKEEEAMLTKLIGKQADFELRIVSTQAKKAYNAQLVKILEEEAKGEAEDSTPKKKKKK